MRQAWALISRPHTAWLYDGTTLDLAKVSGGPEYQKLMVRLSRSPPPDPPSAYQRFLRWTNKKLGRPATPDEDLNDAIEHAGLDSWLTLPMPYPQRLVESRAAFAGSGYGLCQNYKDLYRCEEEYESMAWETVYFVFFSRHALYASLDTFQAAFGLDPLSEPHVLDFESGFSNLPTFASPSAFWSHVRDQLMILPSKSPRRITKLLLGGENATDPDFIATLRDALGAPASLSDDGIPDPTFAAARGAALYARWRQEAPWDCVEDDECDTKRERERGEKSGDASKRVELR
ncbi:hypothetical protein QBC33DRAFT_517234 [Phialemonium atrogriseum]|uniref:Uncharacterized protein n=1 Tax=Phialemonium atrogriseum TaxID=1093897 RepID=A0AAJ0FJ43_9PEZI|nr:uncharacterized protein QBC33DRAFT_517234 [Phialemonium atrogriseum]KAK1765028.1 hypothetical protein QBC33DRAFT_517234 [Phialemonium atrogriseum]